MIVLLDSPIFQSVFMNFVTQIFRFVFFVLFGFHLNRQIAKVNTMFPDNRSDRKKTD